MVKWATAAALIVGGYVLAVISFVFVMNADLYGRLSETHTARGVGKVGESSKDLPIVRLVLHKLLRDENAVEVSLLLTSDGALADLIRNGRVGLVATARDGYLLQPFAIKHSVVLAATTASPLAGVPSLVVQSERFSLPTLPSVNGFPFDDLRIRPIIDVDYDGVRMAQFHFEVQKSFPGRLMELSAENITTVRLTRTPIEKALVVTGSAIFLLLSAILTYAVISRRSLTTLGELSAVGGYLLAAAGFREVLGVSRAAGTSALEVAVLGLPLLALTCAVALSFVRGHLGTGQARPPDRTEGNASPSREEGPPCG